MDAKRFWPLTTFVLLAVCAGLFVETVHGLGSPCWNCSNNSCTAYECFHLKDISDPDSLKEACNPKKCIESVVYYYKCQIGKDMTADGKNGCYVIENTQNAIVVQYLYGNENGDYICGPNMWADVPDCPKQSTCDCGVKYNAVFFGTPQGRCFTRPCDGKKEAGNFGIPTGLDGCSKVP